MHREATIIAVAAAQNEIIDQSDVPNGAIPSWAIPHLEEGRELIGQLDPSNESVDHPCMCSLFVVDVFNLFFFQH